MVHLVVGLAGDPNYVLIEPMEKKKIDLNNKHEGKASHHETAEY